MAIYKEYLDDVERESLVLEMAMSNSFNKLNTMYELVCAKEKQFLDDIELKVLTESGTYDDYEYLVEASTDETGEEKKNIIVKIIEAIKNAVNALINSFKDSFTKKDPSFKAKVDRALADAADHIDDELTVFQNAFQKIKAKDFVGAFNDLKGVITGVLASGVIIGGVAAYRKKKNIKEGETVEKTGAWYNAITDKLTKWVDGIKNMIADVPAWIKGKPAEETDNVQKNTSLIQKIISGVTSLLNSIKNTFAAAFKKKNAEPEGEEQPATNTPGDDSGVKAEAAETDEKKSLEDAKKDEKTTKECIFGEDEVDKEDDDSELDEIVDLVKSI